MNNIDVSLERRKVIIAALAAVVCFYCSATFFTAILPILFVELTGNVSLTGIPIGVFFLAGGLSAPIAARAMDTYGRIQTLRFSLGIGIVGSALCYLGHINSQLALLLSGLTLLGVSGAVVLLSRLMITDMFNAARQAKMMGYVLSGAVIGAIAGPLVGFTQGPSFSANTYVWAYIGVFFFIAFAVSFVARRDSLDLFSDTQRQTQIKPDARETEDACVSGHKGAIYTISACSHGSMVALMTISGFLMGEYLIPEAFIYLGFGLYFICMFGFMPVSSKIFIRIGYINSIFVAAFGFLLSYLLLTFAASIFVFYLVLFFLGISWSISFLATSLKLAEVSSRETRAKNVAINDSLSAIFAALASIAGGVITHSYGQAGLSLFLTFIASLIVFSAIRLDMLVADARNPFINSSVK